MQMGSIWQQACVTMRTPLLSCAGLALAGCPHPAAATGPGSDEQTQVQLFTDCDAGCPEMAVIPAGSFMMGAEGGEEGRPEYPVHEVTIARPFALATLEVSNADYAAFLAATGRTAARGCWYFDQQDRAFRMNDQADYASPGDGAGNGAPDMPAVCVSWLDAQAYVQYLSSRTGKTYRLPTEAEWEYAASAGATTQYPWGADIDQGCGQANIYDAEGSVIGFSGFAPQSADGEPLQSLDHATCSDGHKGAAPVGSFPANRFGLHDIVGNVWEWTQDCYYAPYPDDIPTDGSAYDPGEVCERRSVRGGSWITSPFRIRTAWRGRDPEDQLSWIFGFRVARDLGPGDPGQ
jgi:formylglycine-generating enzyme required for sulfatase activity